MIKRIFDGTVGTSRKVLTDKIASTAMNGIVITSVVTGTGHSESEFDGHIMNVNLRQENGDDIQLISGLRISDAMKISDSKGGFSMAIAGDNAGRYVAYLPLGRIKLEGDDVLEVSLTVPGHATAGYNYILSAVDMADGMEEMIGYELLTGNSSEQFVKNCHSLYLTSPGTGANITVSDQKGSYVVIDNDVIDLGNCVSEMEQYEDFGAIYTDKYGLSQDVRCKLPSGSYGVAVKQFFDPERLQSRQQTSEIEAEELVKKIEQTDPDKYACLKQLNKI